MTEEPRSTKVKATVKEIFTAKNITRLAVFTALSAVLYLFAKFNIPIFPSWLDVQVSELPALLAGYMMGPWYGAVVIILKCAIKMPMSSTACVGEIADIIMGLAFVLSSAYYYKYHRTIKGAIASLAIGVGALTVVAVIVNWAMLIPMYIQLFFGGNHNILVDMLAPLFPSVTWETFYVYYLFGGVLPFNIFRGLICAILTFLLYKHLERFFNYVFANDNKGAHGASTEKVTVKTAAAMQKLGKRIARSLRGGDVVLLTGELGAGKTVFCKGLAKGLGIDTQVVSPTFTIMNEHFGSSGQRFCHIDAYRLSDADEACAAGLGDVIGNSECICAVEWWENIADMFDGCSTVAVKIDKIEKGREVTIER